MTDDRAYLINLDRVWEVIETDLTPLKAAVDEELRRDS